LYLLALLSLGWPVRPVKNAFTSGWVNRYADLAAVTPQMMPARSAAVHLAAAVEPLP
jgi:hypothetical protein